MFSIQMNNRLGFNWSMSLLGTCIRVLEANIRVHRTCIISYTVYLDGLRPQNSGTIPVLKEGPSGEKNKIKRQIECTDETNEGREHGQRGGGNSVISCIKT